MRGQSIYIVEDEIITARSIAKNIKNFGYQLAGIATSGSEAVAQILKIQPDLVLIDILLQKNDIDGITTAQRIQSQINVPIIYLTAHSDQETLNRAKITTPFGYILKPYSEKDLQISIEFALHKHQQEIQLIQREELLSTILNSTQDGIVATNKTSKIIYMNPAAQKLTGWDLHEAYERKAIEVLEMIDERTQQPIDHPLEQVLEQGKVVYLDDYAVLLQKNGQQISISDSASPILKKDDEVISSNSDLVTGAVLIFTPRQIKSPPRIDINQQQQIGAIAADEELNELSAYLLDIVLHELRSPLTVILSTAESLQNYRQKWTIEKQNKSLNRIQQAVRQITRLLDDITVWKELGTGQITVQPNWVNIITLSEEILNNLRLLDSKNYELIIDYQGGEKIFYLDQEILQRILNNLLLNGIKYSPPGSTVTLSIDGTKNDLVLRIKDQGRGIPQAEQHRIFEAFYRASNTEHIKGAGLGLAIVREYVQLCGGEITLESNSGLGTIFTVTLPSNNSC